MEEKSSRYDKTKKMVGMLYLLFTKRWVLVI
jgi:hypothetical protein